MCTTKSNSILIASTSAKHADYVQKMHKTINASGRRGKKRYRQRTVRCAERREDGRFRKERRVKEREREEYRWRWPERGADLTMRQEAEVRS